jgi:hypothetical protein
MFRIFCIALSAFALLAGSASARSSSVTITSLTLDKTTGARGDWVAATVTVRNNRHTSSSRHKLSTFFANGILIGSVPSIPARRTRRVKLPLRQIPAQWRSDYLNYRACLVGRCTKAKITVTAPSPSPTTPLTPVADSFLYFPASGVSFGSWFTTTPTTDLWLVNSSATETSGPVSLTVPVDSGPGHFTIESTTCGAALPPGDSCVANVSFTPVSFGTTTGRLVATATPGIGAPAEVQLTGEWSCTNPGFMPAPRGC